MKKPVRESWTTKPNHYHLCPTCNHYGVVHNKHEHTKCLYCGATFKKDKIGGLSL